MYRNEFNGGATVPHKTIEDALDEAQLVLRTDPTVEFVDVFLVGEAVAQCRMTRRSLYERNDVVHAASVPLGVKHLHVFNRLN